MRVHDSQTLHVARIRCGNWGSGWWNATADVHRAHWTADNSPSIATWLTRTGTMPVIIDRNLPESLQNPDRWYSA